jgi:hypothetical protein
MMSCETEAAPSDNINIALPRTTHDIRQAVQIQRHTGTDDDSPPSRTVLEYFDDAVLRWKDEPALYQKRPHLVST